MARFYIVLTVYLFCFASNVALASNERTTSNPNHKGYYETEISDYATTYDEKGNEKKEKVKYRDFTRVKWQERKTSCIHCEDLNAQYNEVVKNLFSTKTALKQLEYTQTREGR